MGNSQSAQGPAGGQDRDGRAQSSEAAPSAGPPGSAFIWDDDEALRRDRERAWSAGAEPERPAAPAGSGPTRVDPFESGVFTPRGAVSAQEAYDRCARDVHALLKCVDDKGPAWFWSCGDQYVALQACYARERATPHKWGVLDLYDWASKRVDQLKQGLFGQQGS